MLSALGQCLSVGYAAAASSHSVTIKKLTISLSGEINIIPFLGMGLGQGSDHAGYRGINVDVKLETNAARDVEEMLHAHVLKTSPVGHTLARPVPMTINLL